MGNSFATTPDLSPVFPKPMAAWTDPITGFVVPKDPDQNIQWRVRMLTAAENDPDLQVDLYTACSQSVLFFVNAFCFTLRVFESEDGKVLQAKQKHLPYVTWEIQDEHILKIEHAIDEGESLLTDKSRDMGATWDHIVALTHRLIFRDDESHLMISRKEDTVDILDGQPKNYPFGTLADPGTLFGKVDYVLNRLPEWMLPRLLRKKMHIVNLDTRTRIDGESSNANAGSSDRRTSIFLDEMAKMKEAEAIKRSTADVTACRLVCSTPNGAGTTYSKWRLSGTIPVFVLPWWEHPEKGRNRYVKQDDLKRFKIRSPWYDGECEKRSPKELAIEIDMDHIGSGDTFFEATVIEQHKKLFGKPRRHVMDIRFIKSVAEDSIPSLLGRREWKKVSAKIGTGSWRFWTRLVKDMRLDQSKSYTLACDISLGQGASNSVCNIFCNETREKVAEFADANIPPYEFAKQVCAAALWVGGRGGLPLLIWENNGNPGFDFGRQIAQVYRYPKMFFDRATGTLREKQGKRYGWRSSPEKKAVALGMLRRAYAHGKYINHSVESLDEALSYIHYEGGGIGPAALIHESDSARKAHGDRVIADMLCIVGLREAPMLGKASVTAPTRSIGYRLKQFQKAKKAERDNRNKFDFAHAA